MIKLKLIYEQLLKEVGDLENIKSYPYSNNSFLTDLGLKVNVKFQEYDNRDIEALNLNTKYYQAPIFNVVFDVEGDESQFIKTTLDEYLKIIKTVTEICTDFIKEKNPNGLTFFVASKNRNNLFKTDPQKSKFYKVIVIKQLSKIQGWRLINLSLDDEFEGFMMYKKIKNKNMKKYAVLSLSGGMDSSTLLLHLLAKGYEVTALSFDYGQKHKVELERATSLVEYLNGCSHKAEQDKLGTITVTGENFPLIKHQIIKLDGLSQLLNSTLVEGGSDVPEGHYAEANMKDTVVPNRNKIFSSIIQAVALSIADKNEAECSIAMGIHAGDHAIYPDCRQEFRDVDELAFRAGNWNHERVKVYTPYLDTDKFGILEDGSKCCEQLGLDFDEVYKRTNTSYKPIFIKYSWTDMSGEWHSDYKSASSVERVEAFIKLGRPDPCEYADETGPVSWDTVVKHVEQVLLTHKN